jgi:molybdopterin/thiamine biosynthesis adenylyltransferase/rhodanese-related sulfurtransferase
MKINALTENEIQRYHRQMILPELGIVGQEKLKNAKVLVVGAGGLGSPVLFYLASSGVGKIGIVEDDVVEISNLQRQILYTENDVGQSKVVQAQKLIQSLNQHVDVVAHETRFSHENALDLVAQYDLVIDATDNFASRYLINDACVIQNKPFISAAIFRFEGQIAVFNYQGSACYRCLYPVPPPKELVPNCAEGGVIGVLPGIVGCLQANEAIKLITHSGDLLVNALLIVDALKNHYRHLKFSKNAQCPICSEGKNIKLFPNFHYQSEQACEVANVPEITAAELKKMLDNEEAVQIIDVRELAEYEMSHMNGLLIPLSEIQYNIDAILSKINMNKIVVVHCQSGARSADAIQLIKSRLNHGKMYNLKGGLRAWQQHRSK